MVMPRPFFTPLHPPNLPATQFEYQLTSGSQLDRTTQPTVPPSGPWVRGRFVEGLTPTSGSSLDRAEVGAPWPNIIDGALKIFRGWFRRKNLTQVRNVNLPGNYGARTSEANFEFKLNQWPDNGSGFALYPEGLRGQLIPRTPLRPEYNNLIPVVWGLRVTDPGAQAQKGDLIQVQRVQVGSTDYTPAGQANLREVLL